MDIKRNARPLREIAEIKLWDCAACGVVHLAARDIVLNFAPDDFALFAEAVVDIRTTKTPLGRVTDLIGHEADRYMNAVFGDGVGSSPSDL